MHQWVQKKKGKCQSAKKEEASVPGVLSALIHHAVYGGLSPGAVF